MELRKPRSLLGASLVACVCLARIVLAYNNGLSPLPAMGWSTWCTDDFCGATDTCNAAEVMSIADAMVANNMASLGYEYLVLDDCWSAFNRTADGELYALPSEFPDGMPALVSYVHSKGLKLGLYTSIGTETCRRGRPGSFGFYEVDARTFASWGVDYVKSDNCARPSGYTEFELFSNFSAALNATGRQFLFALCEWGEASVGSQSEPWPVEAWGGRIANQYRVQMDHLPFFSLPTKAAGAGYGQGVKQIVEWMAQLVPSRWARPWAIMDPDFLMTLMSFPAKGGIETMSFIDSKTEISFWALWSAPLIVATDIRDPRRVALLSNQEVIAVDQDPLVSGGDRLANNSDGTQVWAKHLANGDMAVLLFNPDDVLPLSCTVEWSLLGWSPAATAAVRDLWAHKDLGSFTGSFRADAILPHDVVFLRVSLGQ